eukprot:Partr_v1_DN28249_c0_g1_i5_m76518 putative suppressor of mek1 (Dictyostelium)
MLSSATSPSSTASSPSLSSSSTSSSSSSSSSRSLLDSTSLSLTSHKKVAAAEVSSSSADVDAAVASASSSSSSTASAVVSDGDATTSVAPAAPAVKDGQWRVKIYELAPSSVWDDKGTGYSDIQYVKGKDAYCLVVRSEDENLVILESAIRAADVYQRQQDTLIIWVEPDGRDMALSFQDSRGCTEIWDSIGDVQRRLHDSLPEGDILMGIEDESLGADLEPDVSSIVVPEITITSLIQVEQFVLELCQYRRGRDRLVRLILTDKFLDRVFDVFEMAEDMEMKEELTTIYSICRNIVMLNDNSLYQYLLREDVCAKLCAVFEYDPEYPVTKGIHRDYLKSSLRYKKVAEFSDAAIESTIHQTFRAQYLKDVVFARIIEDPHFNVIHSIVMFNQVNILNSISADSTFLSKICLELQDAETPGTKKKLILQFIQDFCVIARNLQMVKRNEFYSAIASKGVLQELQPFLIADDYNLRLVSADIMSHALDHDASLVRSFIMSQSRHSSKTLSEVIISALITDPDTGLKFHYAEILRMLLDWSGSEQGADPENSEFIHLFYNQQLSIMVQPFKDLKVVPRPSKADTSRMVVDLCESESSSCQLVGDILCGLIRLHASRMKSYILRENLLPSVLKLLKCKQGVIRLLPVRILRSIVGCKDEFYNRYITKNDIFRELFTAFQQNGVSYNMFNSSVLELLDFIKSNNIQSLTFYIVEKYKSVLEGLTYSPLGQDFIKAYNNTLNKDLQSAAALMKTKSSVPSRVGAWNAADKDEEAYFEEDDLPLATQKGTVLDDEPPIPKKKKEDDNDADIFAARIGHKPRSQSLPPSRTGDLPSTVSVRKKHALVDYADDDPTDRSSTTSSSSDNNKMPPSTPPKLRNITLGAKRIAIDETDPRNWDREMVMDIGPSSSSPSPPRVPPSRTRSQSTPPIILKISQSGLRPSNTMDDASDESSKKKRRIP